MVSENEQKEGILDCAEKLFERYGYSKTTVDEIAKEAGIGKGSIYLHFESKEDLAFAWVDRIHGHLQNEMQEILNGSGSFAVRLREALCRRVLFRYDVFACHSRSMDEAFESLRIKLLGRRDAFHELEARLIKRHIEEGAEAGEFRTLDPEKTSRSMVTATNALMPYSLRPEQIGDRNHVLSRINDLADLLVLAVKKELS